MKNNLVISDLKDKQKSKFSHSLIKYRYHIWRKIAHNKKHKCGKNRIKFINLIN